MIQTYHLAIHDIEQGFHNRIGPRGQVVEIRNWDENQFFKPKELDFFLIL